MFQEILVAHDGSTGAQKAMAVAIGLAKRFGAEIHLISVIEELPKYAATIDEVQEVNAEAIRHYRAIQDEACRQADFILIGHAHQQFVKQVGQKTFVNPGSLGQSKGVGPVACYAIWEDGQVELKRIPYSFWETMAKIDHTPLAPAIKEKLKMVLERGVLG